MEKSEEQFSAINEYFNLLQQLALTAEEHKNYLEWQYYNKHPYLFKRCKTCGRIKKIEEFYKNVMKKQGVFDECKECVKARSKRQRMKKYILND